MRYPALEKVAATGGEPGRRILPALVKPVAAIVAPVPETPAPRSRRPWTRRSFSIIEPDADNVVQLNPNLFIAPVQTTNNPFLQLYQPPTSQRMKRSSSQRRSPARPDVHHQRDDVRRGDKFEGAIACTGWTPTKSTSKGARSSSNARCQTGS